MARNTGDCRFRKLDVDNFGETNLQDDGSEDIANFNEKDVENLCNSGKYTDAITTVLNTAPVNTKDQALKDAASMLILRAMSNLKSTQIDDYLQSLNQAQLDLLMKFVYRGFQNPKDITHASLLTWHEKVFARGHISSIVRVLTDAKSV